MSRRIRIVKKPALAFGENGALEFSSTGNPSLDLFNGLVRSLPDERLNDLVDKCLLSSMDNGGDASVVVDLFVLMFQTRDCRGGKGERDLFYKMLCHLYSKFPHTVINVLPLIGEFGYWKDYFRILELIAIDKPELESLGIELVGQVALQLQRDYNIMSNVAEDSAISNSGYSFGISNCAKYSPREGHRFASKNNAKFFKELIQKLFPGAPNGKQLYRQLVSKLSAALDVTEIKMCGKHYQDISFSKVSSICMNKNKKAFLNEKLKVIPSGPEDLTGNRYPNDEDRVVCRKKLRTALLEKRVHGKQLFPHEIVSQIKDSVLSTLDYDILNAQWVDIRSNLLAKLSETQQSGIAASVNVGKLVPLVDVSGSMSGEPMEVAIALGILVSEVNHPAFRNRFITFHEQPSWVNLDNLNTIAEKVLLAREAPWGGSTNIESAFNLILKVVVDNRLPIDEVPDLIIFSDMQFNQADNKTTSGTYLDIIKIKFADAGTTICGSPYPMPKIIFWNLRGNTRGHAAAQDSENVQLLSGFSPSLLKHVLEGEPLEMEVEEVVEEVNEDGKLVSKKVKTTRKITPYDTLRKVLDDIRYDPLRIILSNCNEGILSQYHFEPVTTKADGSDMVIVDDVEMTS
eukprot:gene7317-9969_t